MHNHYLTLERINNRMEQTLYLVGLKNAITFPNPDLNKATLFSSLAEAEHWNNESHKQGWDTVIYTATIKQIKSSGRV